MNKAKIYLVDDHQIFREGLRNLIELEGIGTVVGESSNGKHFIQKYKEQNPDLVIMDICMPIMNGIDAAQKAIKKDPGLKVIALSMNGEEEYYYKMIEAGVKGFLLKKSGIKEIEKGYSYSIIRRKLFLE